MCDDHKRREKIDKPHKVPPLPRGKLYGVGIGPGDPKLLTLKAKEVLDQVDTIFFPRADEGGTSTARSIVEAVLSGPKECIELPFPMAKDEKKLISYWKDAARQIAQAVEKGKEVAFVTMGDPFIYSTYIYLLKTLRQDFPEIHVETIPGISAINAAASRAELPLVQGNEKMAILPVTEDLRGLRGALNEFDTVVLMKVGSRLNKVLTLLKGLDLLKNSTLVSRLGHPEERVISDLDSIKEERSGYLSLMFIKVPRKE